MREARGRGEEDGGHSKREPTLRRVVRINTSLVLKHAHPHYLNGPKHYLSTVLTEDVLRSPLISTNLYPVKTLFSTDRPSTPTSSWLTPDSITSQLNYTHHPYATPPPRRATCRWIHGASLFCHKKKESVNNESYTTKHNLLVKFLPTARPSTTPLPTTSQVWASVQASTTLHTQSKASTYYRIC